MATAKKSLDLGALQDNSEKAAREYKSAKTAYQRAFDAFTRAEENHEVAQKSLKAGAGQLLVQTKVI